MAMKPKGPQAALDTPLTELEGNKVRSIDSAKSKGGRPSGLGYDPATGEEHQTGGDLTRPDAGEVDVLGLVGQRGYSEDRFYTKSSNQHDHGAELRVRVPKGIDSQIHAAVSDVPEYRNLQDFWRDAAVHRLEYLQKRYNISEEGRRMLELERLRADSERRATDMEIMAETVADLGVKLASAWERRDFGVLALELEEGEELIDWMRDPYRSQVQDTLRDWKERSRQQIAEYRAQLDD